MKKTFKRAGIAVLSMSMLLSMGAMTAISSSAVDMSYQSITISDTYGGTYNIYKVLDATVSSGGLAYDYTFAAGFSSADCGKTVEQIAATDSSDAVAMKNLANALRTDSNDAIPVNSSVAAGSSVTLAPGYYLITCVSGTQMTVAPTLISVRSDSSIGTITPKTSKIPFDKKIASITDGKMDDKGNGDTAQANIGAIIDYTIDSKLPKYASTVTSLTTAYTITDNPSAGLTIDKDSIKVFVDENDDNSFASTEEVTTKKFDVSGTATDIVTVNKAPAASSGGFSVTFNDNYVLDQKDSGHSVQVQFKAVLNKNADLTTAGNPNEATLDFDNDYYDGNGYKKLKDETNVFSALLKLTKTFSDPTDNSNGNYPTAEFTLYEGSTGTGTIAKIANTSSATGETMDAKLSTTSGSNVLSFSGLKAGTYTLVETGVPTGYKKADNITFTFEANQTGQLFDGTYTVTSGSVAIGTDNEISATVNNTKGETLPGTGGMGTILFTVGGAAIVLLAGALFVVYMRKRKVEE